MTRDLSGRFIEASRAQASGEVYLELIRISHPSMSQPIRIVADTVAVTHQGEVFAPFPFTATTPDEVPEGTVPVFSLSVGNVSREVIEEMRQMSGYPTIDLIAVLRSQPDVIERRIEGMELRAVEYDAYSIRGTAVVTPASEGPVSRDRFSPALYPGLY